METNILHLGTYMCPGIPVEYYEFIAEYLEKELCLQTTLLYNSRSRGPDISRGDHQRIDLAFVTTSAYLENFKSGTNNFQLLPVGAVTKHPVKGEVLGYYTDIVVHRDVNMLALSQVNYHLDVIQKLPKENTQESIYSRRKLKY